MIIFLILIERICCDPSSEQSWQDGSDGGSQHMIGFFVKIHILESSKLDL